MAQHAARNARKIFLEAVEQHAPEEWPDFLDSACHDPRLRQQVQKLLQAHQRQDSWLDRADGAGRLSAGTQVGHYRVLEEIGEGGFGIVYRAEQTEPIVRQVALKIIKPGMDTRQVVARFHAERQTLALMHHPGIAAVLDAGSTETGYPYFVMELVPGQPLTEYCDAQQLALPERLELLARVCDAVQHAHEKGIVHRDLKPSNILVMQQDGQAQIKVIDFGVAKALHQRLTDQTLRTASSQLLGTPRYMSPEQADRSVADIDTRSDVYSLSVVLYELLTGTTPFDSTRLSHTSPLHVPQLLRETESVRPSRRVTSLDAATRTTRAARRQLASRRWASRLRGELDWIVMKGLEKDPSRRYETARGLGEDLRRFLQHEPVAASPPAIAYQLKRWLGRGTRRYAAWLAAAVTLLLLVVVACLLHQWNAVQQQHAQMQQLALLAADQVKREDLVQAERNYRKLAVMQETLLRDDDQSVLSSLYQIAEILYRQRRWSDALPIIERVYASERAIGELQMRNRDRVAYMLCECCLARCWEHLEPQVAYDGATTADALRLAQRAAEVKGDLDRIPMGTPLQSTRLWYSLGWCHALAGREADVEASIWRMVDADGDRPCKYLLRAILHQQLGDPAFAQAAWLVARDCLRRSPSTYAVSLPFDEQYQESLERAAALIGIAADGPPEADAAVAQVRAYQLLLQSHPDDAALRFGSGLAHARIGDWLQAEAEFDRAVQLDPSTFEPWEAAALAALQNGRMDRYRDTCRRAVRRFRYTDNLSRLLCLCAVTADRSVLSDELQQRVAYASHGPQLLTPLALGSLQYRCADYAGAEDTLPGDGPDACSVLGDLYRALCLKSQGQMEAARRRLQQTQARYGVLPPETMRGRPQRELPEPPLETVMIQTVLREALQGLAVQGARQP